MNRAVYPSEWVRRLSGLLSTCFALPLFLWFALFVSELEVTHLSGWQLTLAWVMLPAIYLLTIAVHEGGHWLAGHLAGLRCMRVSVAWAHWERTAPATWRLQLRKRMGLWGLVQQYPVQGDGARRRKMISTISGPLANLVTGAGSLWYGLELLHQPSPTAPHFYAMHGLLLYAVLSGFTGTSNLLPMTFKSGHRSDGQLLWDLWRKEPAMERLLAYALFAGSSYAGVRPRELAGAWLRPLLAFTDGTILDCHAHVLAYLHYLDAQQIERAQQHLSAALPLREVTPLPYQQHLLCEAAYMAAVYEQDANQAQVWLQQAEQVREFEGNESYFSRATVACAVGDLKQARVWLKLCEADPNLGDANDQGGRLFALDRLAALRNRIHLREETLTERAVNG